MLKAIAAIARKAGEATLRFYQTELDIETKSDDSPLTIADRTSHEIIVEGLQSLPEVLPVLSEESTPEEIAARRHWNRYWLVDPLDGTKEFIRGSGEYTVNIALIEDGKPILGVVYQPVTRRLFAGESGVGATQQKGEEEATPIQVTVADPQALRLVLSASHASPAMLQFLRQRPQWKTSQAGSSLKFCLVASGEADLYPRMGPTMEWDTGAAQCIVEAAGGQVLDLSGQPLRYNKESLENPPMITLGDASIEWKPLVEAARG